jgi:DNA-directed RNA polymerase specialized sigma24 family protein
MRDHDLDVYEVPVRSAFDDRQLCFGNPAKLGSLAGPCTAQELWGDVLDWTRIDEARFTRELDHIPALEADLIEATIWGCRQQDLATVFEMTQANVSYRLHRGLDRLRFATSLPEITPEELRQVLDDYLSDLQIEMLVRFGRTKNMTEVARTLELPQSKARTLMLDALDVLGREPALERYAGYFAAIMRRVGHTLQPRPQTKAARDRSERLARIKSAAAT